MTEHSPAEPPPPSPDPIPDFYVTVVAGLERVAAAELSRLGADLVSTRPGKAFFSFKHDPALLLDLRSVMHLYAFIAEHTGCPPDPSAQLWLEDAARSLDLRPALAHHAALHGHTHTPTFRVTAARSGRHDYTSPRISAWVGSGVQAQTSWPVNLEGFDYDVEAELVDDRALFGLRLSARWKDRHRKPVYHPASLNPTVAYAMVSLLSLDPSDIFLDPACGGGTLLTERAALAPSRLILGGDVWPTALDYATQTLAAAGVRASLVRWDARTLPLAPASIDRVASNLPFGHRISHGPIVRNFYRRLLPELTRVLRPGGRAALLTSRRRWLGRALLDNPELRPDSRMRIILGGKEAYIFLVSRTP